MSTVRAFTPVPRASHRIELLLAAGLLALVIGVLAVPGAAGAWDRLAGGPVQFVPLLALVAFAAYRRPVGAVWAIAAFLVLNGYAFAHGGSSLRLPTQGLVLGLLLAAIVARLTRPAVAPVSRPGLILLGLYLVLSALMIAIAPERSIAVQAYREQLLPLMLLPAVALYPWSPGQLRRIVAGVVVSVVAGGLYAMLRLVTGPDGSELAIARETSHRVGGELALYGSFISRQDLATWASVGAPFLVALLPLLRGRWRLAALAGVAMCGVAVLESEVRVALVGVAVGCATVLVISAVTRMQRPEVGRIVAVVALVSVVGGLVYAGTVRGDSASQQRFEAVLDPGSDFSFSRRQSKWSDVIPDINREALGHGLGTAGQVNRERGRFYTPDHYSIDNAYLQLAYQQGWAVVALLGGAVVLLLLGLCTTVMRASAETAALRSGAIGAVVAWSIALAAGDYLETGGTFLAMLVAGVAVAGVRAALPGQDATVRRERSSSAAGAKPSRWATR